MCRSANGSCEAPATCDGSSGACPANRLFAPGVECREARDACDLAERCTGSSATCPADVKATAGTACDDADPCSVGDRCDGTGLCAGAAPFACDDGDPCTVDRCTQTTGCISTPLSGMVEVHCRVDQCAKPALQRRLRRITTRLGRTALGGRHARQLERRLRKLLVRCGIRAATEILHTQMINEVSQ
jgi:hypothetical protein